MRHQCLVTFLMAPFGRWCRSVCVCFCRCVCVCVWHCVCAREHACKLNNYTNFQRPCIGIKQIPIEYANVQTNFDHFLQDISGQLCKKTMQYMYQLVIIYCSCRVHYPQMFILYQFCIYVYRQTILNSYFDQQSIKFVTSIISVSVTDNLLVNS